jgi:hypothetical protein
LDVQLANRTLYEATRRRCTITPERLKLWLNKNGTVPITRQKLIQYLNANAIPHYALHEGDYTKSSHVVCAYMCNVNQGGPTFDETVDLKFIFTDKKLSSYTVKRRFDRPSLQSPASFGQQPTITSGIR